MNSKEVSMKEVAKLAGVSTATVSHVINHSCKVKAKTEAQVNKAIKELSYKVNPIARKLRTGNSKIIGFIVSNLAHYFYTELGNAIEEVLNAKGYELFYINSNENPQKEIEQIELCSSEGFAGLIIVPVNEDWENIEKNIATIPVVFLDRKPSNIRRDAVLTTNTQSSFLLTTQLIKQGAKNIAFIAPQHDNTMQLRIDGFKDALFQHNLEISDKTIFFGNRRPKVYGELASDIELDKIFSYVVNEKKADCIICGNELIAFCAINYFIQHKVPNYHKILFGTFENAFWMHTVNIQIVSIAQDTKKMGAKAANLLVSRLERKTFPFEDHCIDTKMLFLNSSKK